MNERNIKDITNFMFISDEPQKSDIIFLPGTSKSAIAVKAAELYRAGFASYILPSGKFSSSIGRVAKENIDDPRYVRDYATEFEYFKYVLLDNGVPENAILCEDKATNSMENAIFSARVLQEKGIEIKKAILCCQSYHSRRALMSYSLHFPSIDFRVVSTDTQGITKENWHTTEKGYLKIMSELEKCGMYFKNIKRCIK